MQRKGKRVIIKQMKKTKKANKPDKRELTRQQRKKAIIESLKNGAFVGEAVAAADSSYGAYYDWLDEDKEFAKAVKNAEKAQIKSVEDALVRSAKGGSVTAQIFYLCNRKPDTWKSINSTVHSFSKEFDESLEKMAEVIKGIRGKKGNDGENDG